MVDLITIGILAGLNAPIYIALFGIYQAGGRNEARLSAIEAVIETRARFKD